MHMCYERPPGLVNALNAVGYDKWDRGGGGGGGGVGSSGTWGGRERERERDRERERQARAHQMAHAPEPDASSLFPAPVRVTGNTDRTSQQIQNKLGDYRLAQPFLDDPSKSIGICEEPPIPSPCPPSRRENEFKKPSHAPAPQNGRVHHRPHNNMYNKNEISGSSHHRPPQLRIPNGYQHQNNIDSSQPPIESILKEMKSLPTPLSVLAATPRKELDNKFIFNDFTNKVQVNPLNEDLKPHIPKPGLDNRISNLRNSVSPDVVNKDPTLSESDDENAAPRIQLDPLISPIRTGSCPSSGSSSPSDSESSSSSSSSAPAAAPPAAPPAPTPTERPSWSLSNFAPPVAALPEQPQYDSGKELEHALADVKGKTTIISDLSDSEASSPEGMRRRRRSVQNKRMSTASSDDDSSTTHNNSSPRIPSSVPVKRGRPPKTRVSVNDERPNKRKRGRPPKRPSPPSPPSPLSPPTPPSAAASPASAESDNEPTPVTSVDNKCFIFRKVFTPKKGDEGGGKGGKGGKGKGGKGQVTVIEANAPADHERTHRDRSNEMRKNEEAIAARLSPYSVPDVARRREDRISNERLDRTNDRISSDRISNERLSERIPNERLSSDRHPNDRLSDRMMNDKLMERLERPVERRGAQERYVKAEADVGSAHKTDRGSERISEPSSNGSESRAGAPSLMVRIPLSSLRAETARSLRARRATARQNRTTRPLHTPIHTPLAERVEECAVRTDVPSAVSLSSLTSLTSLTSLSSMSMRRRESSTSPVYYSYFERLPADVLSDEERDHKYYLSEAKRLRGAADREHEPLARVMLYLESVLCFVLTGRVLELESDTKRAFTIYRETIEYIKSIHSMPQRYRASPHSTFSKLDILSLRVQALLYLRMFKMYNREVKEYYKIVQEYQQKIIQPPSAESTTSVSPLSPSPSPAGSVGSAGSAGSTSSGYCSVAHAVPAPTHHALLQLTKYYTFLYVAHELWEQADSLCRMRPNQDLFIAVDRKCGPLTLFSTFRHLVQYVRYAISLLKRAPRE